MSLRDEERFVVKLLEHLEDRGWGFERGDELKVLDSFKAARDDTGLTLVPKDPRE